MPIPIVQCLPAKVLIFIIYTDLSFVLTVKIHMQQSDPGFDLPKEGVSVTELKRIIEMLPLETSAVNAVAPRLAMLDPKQFAALLTELARDNHAFRYVSASIPSIPSKRRKAAVCQLFSWRIWSHLYSDLVPLRIQIFLSLNKKHSR